MSTVEPSGSVSRSENKPVATWVLMILALVVILVIPDWTGSGGNRPIWIFAIPVVLGLIGAGFALYSKHIWWAVASAVWGFVLVQGLVVVVTLIVGP